MPTKSPTRLQRAQIVVARAVEQIIGERRAGRDRLYDFALHDSLGELRIFGLLANGDAKSLLDQSPQIFTGGFDRERLPAEPRSHRRCCATSG